MTYFVHDGTHPRYACAHLLFHFRRQRVPRTRLSFQANQLTFNDNAEFGCPQIQVGRQASSPAFVGTTPTASRLRNVFVISRSCALIVTRFAGLLGLRPLAPLPVRACHHQSNPSDTLDFACSFVLPSAVPPVRLGSGRISNFTPGVRRSQAAGINSSPVCGLTIAANLSEPSSRSCVMQESDFPGGTHFGPFLLRKNRPFPRVRHASNQILNVINKMPRNAKPGTARIDLDISLQAQQRFTALHQAFGFKTKTETFEAILYAVSTQDKIDPHAVERIERKLDNFFELMEEIS